MTVEILQGKKNRMGELHAGDTIYCHSDCFHVHVPLYILIFTEPNFRELRLNALSYLQHKILQISAILASKTMHNSQVIEP